MKHSNISSTTTTTTAIKIILAISLISALFGCGGGTSTASTDPSATTPATTTTPVVASPEAEALRAAGLKGKSLWSANCASCHGSDLGKGANPSNIMNAIASNKGGMGFLNGVITADNASNIATYVANPAVN